MSKDRFMGKWLRWLVLIYLVTGAVLLLLIRHGEGVLWLNERHTAFGDLFFKYWTFLGDGLVLGILALLMLFLHYYRFLLLMIAIAFQTAFVHLFKQWLAAGEPRPKTFFADQLGQLNFVEGVKVNAFDSFPSGHTASGFTLVFFLVLSVKNETLRLALFIGAVLVGISRIYLLQHFMVDVYVGSLFGMLSVWIAWRIMDRYKNRSALQRGLLINTRVDKRG